MDWCALPCYPFCFEKPLTIIGPRKATKAAKIKVKTPIDTPMIDNPHSENQSCVLKSCGVSGS